MFLAALDEMLCLLKVPGKHKISTQYCFNVGRRANIEAILGECVVFAGLMCQRQANECSEHLLIFSPYSLTIRCSKNVATNPQSLRVEPRAGSMALNHSPNIYCSSLIIKQTTVCLEPPQHSHVKGLYSLLLAALYGMAHSAI